MKDIRQSEMFADFMEKIGWQTKLLDKNFIYLRRFPILGNFAKLPRIVKLRTETIPLFIKEYNIFHMKVSPFLKVSNSSNNLKTILFNNDFQIEKFPFNPTTTIQIGLRKDINNIFSNFNEAKRRAVRRALKNQIEIRESDDLDSFIMIRKKQYSPMGFLLVKEMQALWDTFYPTNASLLLAYHPKEKTAFSGILLLFYRDTAYYWYASSLLLGKKSFAPTLLVWEALKLSKKRGYKFFDFEGIYDERFPKAGKSWKGFTKFKEGFGGEKIIFLENFYK